MADSFDKSAACQEMYLMGITDILGLARLMLTQYVPTGLSYRI